MDMKAVLGFAALFVFVTASHPRHAFDRIKPRSIGERNAPEGLSSYLRRQAPSSSPYLNNVTQQFVVNGTGVPDINFDIGETYAGLLPISDAANETRKLFFWFLPSKNPLASNEIIIWFNGGPGCSSLTGLIKESGPFLWQAGTANFTQNSWAWTNLTNMVYIEQPIGVGFTQGTPNVTDEVQLANEFAGFWKNFVSAFNLQSRDMYITGESYGGYYVPYVANNFIGQDDPAYFNLKGVAINDPILTQDVVQQDAIVTPYVDYWSNIFNFNESFTEQLHSLYSSCGYEAYVSEYLVFPPCGPIPVPNSTSGSDPDTCSLWNLVYDAISWLSPCFNVYHITDFCPPLYNPEVPYFNRPDVQAAINAPVGTVWQQCTNTNVFPPNGDQSLGPAQDGVLQSVIEHTNNTIIGVGRLDYILPTNGTLIALQNVTWNGDQGFQSYPGDREFFVPYHPEYSEKTLAAAGYVGKWGQERGLTFYEVYYAGHQQPLYAPGSSYRVIELLLGRISALDQTEAGPDSLI